VLGCWQVRQIKGAFEIGVDDQDGLMDDLYREQIIDRYKNPLLRGTLDPHDYSYEDDNPLCGDRIRIDLRVDGQDRVTEAMFSGTGCAISQASADLLVESVVGKTLDEVKQLSKEDILDMLGIQLGPVRLKCALLSLKVLKAGVYGIDELEKELI
jgi:nitrogen fixation NifU-like protein